MISPWLIIGAAALAGGAYWQGRQDGRDSQLAEAARDTVVAAIASEAAASAAAEAISKITVTHRTIRQELQRDIVEKPVYRDPDCRTGSDSLRRFNSAIPGSAQPGADRRELPASDAGH
ncbi:hypothetical protein CDN99_06705 [Roseateles aquatilis]|uniref:Uncharacterized protein n=1 Tax=Roseateles aquatilis TaxID=431061 RepID=A0A246JHQ2_9BURK|nr:hypothetical protein [Roseateles aquatilis]OWQ92043.1 hypothetical protein CDN99_06705 [Roseateles aquatilis]